MTEQEIFGFRVASASGDIVTMNKIISACSKEDIQAVIKISNYIIFQQVAFFGHERAMQLLFDLTTLEQRQAMIEADNYRAFQYAAKNENINIMQLIFNYAAPEQQQAVIETDNYLAFQWAVYERYIEPVIFILLNANDIEAVLESVNTERLDDSNPAKSFLQNPNLREYIETLKTIIREERKKPGQEKFNYNDILENVIKPARTVYRNPNTYCFFDGIKGIISGYVKDHIVYLGNTDKEIGYFTKYRNSCQSSLKEFATTPNAQTPLQQEIAFLMKVYSSCFIFPKKRKRRLPKKLSQCFTSIEQSRARWQRYVKKRRGNNSSAIRAR